jgi:hypothetical protein
MRTGDVPCRFSIVGDSSLLLSGVNDPVFLRVAKAKKEAKNVAINFIRVRCPGMWIIPGPGFLPRSSRRRSKKSSRFRCIQVTTAERALYFGCVDRLHEEVRADVAFFI